MYIYLSGKRLMVRLATRGQKLVNGHVKSEFMSQKNQEMGYSRSLRAAMIEALDQVNTEKARVTEKAKVLEIRKIVRGKVSEVVGDTSRKDRVISWITDTVLESVPFKDPSHINTHEIENNARLLAAAITEAKTTPPKYVFLRQGHGSL